MPEEQQSPEPASGGSVHDASSTIGPPRDEELPEEPLGGLPGEKPSPDAGTASRDLPPEAPTGAKKDESETTTTQ
jgi:hypothetical protein